MELVLLVVLVVAAGVAYLLSYHRFVRDRQAVSEAWATIDAELERRHALVPQLIEAVRAAAGYELGLLTELARRNEAAAASPHTPAAANTWEPPLADAVHQVIALRERYPQLDSQRNFLALQAELATTEDRIAAARRFYNTRVERLNRRVEAVPSAIVARLHGIDRAEFVEA